jgi:predicted 3-demethylubiquinone-9 3-methyltransferase (glyoxalase superfamily)
MNTIVPHLWFDKEAREAAEFYTGLFENSRILRTQTLHDTPSGDAETVSFTLAGQPFEAISAGPFFQLNETASLFVACASEDEVNRLWAALATGGEIMMELGEYPFSRRYGWLADRYGLNWQLSYSGEAIPAQKINVNLLFCGAVNGMAEQAARFYTDTFPNSTIDLVSHYAPGEASAKTANANYIGFTIDGVRLSAMDHGFDVQETFNEAFSLIVYCDTQEEIDAYWARLSHVPEAEACGWLKDRYGVSWQIVPRIMGDMMKNGSPEQLGRVTEAFLKMKKFDIAALQSAFEGR